MNGGEVLPEDPDSHCLAQFDNETKDKLVLELRARPIRPDIDCTDVGHVRYNLVADPLGI